MRVGLDLVAVERIAALVAAHPASEAKLFAEGEVAAARELAGRRREEFLAGRFAVKEAFFKAVGGPARIDPRDVACIAAPSGEPSLELAGTAKAALEKAGCAHAAVSISHDAGLATAVVLAW